MNLDVLRHEDALADALEAVHQAFNESKDVLFRGGSRADAILTLCIAINIRDWHLVIPDLTESIFVHQPNNVFLIHTPRQMDAVLRSASFRRARSAEYCGFAINSGPEYPEHVFKARLRGRRYSVIEMPATPACYA